MREDYVKVQGMEKTWLTPAAILWWKKLDVINGSGNFSIEDMKGMKYVNNFTGLTDVASITVEDEKLALAYTTSGKACSFLISLNSDKPLEHK